MMVIGLIGGVASGKSFVARCFRELGAAVIDADQVGHQVLGRPEVVAAIAKQWPEAINEQGQIDRKRLAEKVFDPSDGRQELGKLEAITHPLIGQEIDAQIAALREQHAVAVVLDAPVLLEAGWSSKCDRVVFVVVPFEVRQQRASRRGWQPDEIQKRERSQRTLEEKQNESTDIIDNSGDEDLTREQVRRLWKQWQLN